MPDDPDVPAWRERIELLTGGDRGRLPVVLAAAAALAALCAWALLGGRSEPPELSLPVAGGPGDPAIAVTTSTARDVLVHAAGAVVAPGVYRVPHGARVVDLLDAAGGPAEGADLDRLNLAAPLTDGERVYVPRAGEEVPPVAAIAASGAGGEGPGPAVVAPIDLNAASVTELDALPGVGPATAQAIVDERGRRGRFRSVDELLDVRGIGPARLEAIRAHVRV